MFKNYYAINEEKNYLVKFHDAYRRYVFVRGNPEYHPIGTRVAKQYPQYSRLASGQIGRELIMDMFDSIIGYVDMDRDDTCYGIVYL